MFFFPKVEFRIVNNLYSHLGLCHFSGRRLERCLDARSAQDSPTENEAKPERNVLTGCCGIFFLLTETTRCKC